MSWQMIHQSAHEDDGNSHDNIKHGEYLLTNYTGIIISYANYMLPVYQTKVIPNNNNHEVILHLLIKS